MISGLYNRGLALGLISFLLPFAAQAAKAISFKIQLTQPLSTKANLRGDKIVAVVLLPESYKGAILEGAVGDVRRGGKLKKESALDFGFSVLNYNGKAVPVRTELVRFYNSKGQKDADENGQPVRKKNGIIGTVVRSPLEAGAGVASGVRKAAGVGVAVGLTAVRFGSKAEDISFNSGSIFEVALKPQK